MLWVSLTAVEGGTALATQQSVCALSGEWSFSRLTHLLFFTSTTSSSRAAARLDSAPAPPASAALPCTASTSSFMATGSAAQGEGENKCGGDVGVWWGAWG